MTSCPRTPLELDAYLDRELSATESVAFEKHLDSCPQCRAMLSDGTRLREALRDPALRYAAPAALFARIDATIPHDSASAVRVRDDSRSYRRWIIAACTLAAAACVAFAIITIQVRPSGDALIAQEIVSAHVRSMMANHLLDVPSLDRHTVKPWFEGKLDFAPPVKDTAAEGFPLIGGRLDYIADHPAAALVYKRQQHIINLLIWESGPSPDQPARVLTRQGYNLIRWTRGGMTFWAVSDVELTELQRFAAAQQAN